MMEKLLEEHMLQYSAFRAHKNLMLFVPPFMVVIGTVGNVLSLVILTRKPMRKLSTYTYLAVLSVTDTLVLYIGLLRLWVTQITGQDFRNHGDWVCKSSIVLAYTVSDYSVWLIIAMTVERWIAVCLPLKAPSLCNRRKACAAIVAICLLLVCLNSHFFWTTGIRSQEYGGKIYHRCDGKPEYERLVSEIWPWVDAFVYSFFPFVIILTLNALIIHAVLLSKKQRSGLGAMQLRPLTQQQQRNGHSEHSRKLTIMLLTISFTFLLTTLPMNVLLIVKAFVTSNSANINEEMVANMMLARTVTELLMYTNHSMNFFLYCATGEKFRQQLCLIFCRTKTNLRTRGRDTTHPVTERTTLTPSPHQVNGGARKTFSQNGNRLSPGDCHESFHMLPSQPLSKDDAQQFAVPCRVTIQTTNLNRPTCAVDGSLAVGVGDTV